MGALLCKARSGYLQLIKYRSVRHASNDRASHPNCLYRQVLISTDTRLNLLDLLNRLGNCPIRGPIIR